MNLGKYAAVVPLLFSLSSCRKAADAASDQWLVADGADPKIDTKTFTMVRFAEGPMSTAAPSLRAHIAFACEPPPKPIAIGVVVPSEFGPSMATPPEAPLGVGPVEVRYRVDSEPFVADNWLAGGLDTKTTTLGPMANGHSTSDLLGKMRRGSVLTIQYTPANRTERTLTFRLGPFDSLLARAQQTCGGRLVVD